MIRQPIRQQQAGFTLVEVFVSITVTTFMALLVGDYMMRNLQQSTMATVRTALYSETAQSLDSAANDIRLSANADLNNRWPDSNGPSGASNLYSWTSNSTTLVLATAAQDSSGNIIFSDSKNYITQKNNIVYFLSGTTLYKRTIAANVSGNTAKTSCPAASATPSCPADKELLHNVTTFSITYLDNQNQSVAATSARSIELHVTAAKKVNSQTISTDYTTRMVFRND